jgi:acyl-coenzyme A synthetase/AMP-(fatty) acid ligase
MQPSTLLWRNELPRSPNGKIDRAALEQELTA